MRKFKINKKACSNCGLEAAVARKVCAGCNTPFYSKRPTYYYEVKDGQTEADGASTSSTGPLDMHALTSSDGAVTQPNEENGRRRTERVKREKPHFYDASEFENKNKKTKTDKSSKVGKSGKDCNAEDRREKKRLRELKMRETLAKAEDENLYKRIMTPHKVEQLAVILEELNYKLSISSWKPS